MLCFPLQRPAAYLWSSRAPPGLASLDVNAGTSERSGACLPLWCAEHGALTCACHICDACIESASYSSCHNSHVPCISVLFQGTRSWQDQPQLDLQCSSSTSESQIVRERQRCWTPSQVCLGSCPMLGTDWPVQVCLNMTCRHSWLRIVSWCTLSRTERNRTRAAAEPWMRSNSNARKRNAMFCKAGVSWRPQGRFERSCSCYLPSAVAAAASVFVTSLCKYKAGSLKRQLCPLKVSPVIPLGDCRWHQSDRCLTRMRQYVNELQLLLPHSISMKTILLLRLPRIHVFKQS